MEIKSASAGTFDRLSGIPYDGAVNRLDWPIAAMAMIVALAVPRLAIGEGDHPSIRNGKAHPILVAKSINGGDPLILDQYRGKKVIIVHLASWDPESVAQLPVWEKFAKSASTDSLVVLGMLHDLDFDRASLFAKWKQIGFPVYHDALNSVNARRMSRAVCIDEHGIVQVISGDIEKITERFVNKEFKFDRNAVRTPVTELPKVRFTKRTAYDANRPLEFIRHGDACFWESNAALASEAIEAYRRAYLLDTSDAVPAFRLGCAYFWRFQSESRAPADLQHAFEAWCVAADREPKNQVFRERLGQFSATPDKRVCSYCWIAEAIQDSGSAPLVPMPMPIEVASPGKQFAPSLDKSEAPPGIAANESALVIDAGIVRLPDTKVAGLVNVVVALIPNAVAVDADRPIRIWVAPSKGVEVDQRIIEIRSPASSNAGRPLMLSVAARLSDTSSDAAHVLKCSAVFESAGAPMRCDFEISIPSTLPDIGKL